MTIDEVINAIGCMGAAERRQVREVLTALDAAEIGSAKEATFELLIPGTRVRMNNTVSPKYLIGLTGTVTQRNRTKVKVRFDESRGRFSSERDVNCPVNILEIIS